MPMCRNKKRERSWYLRMFAKKTAANGPANAAMQKQQWGFAVEGMEDVEEEITDIPQVSEEVLENESVAKDSQSVLEDTKESLENAEFCTKCRRCKFRREF